jgi:pimeloyl-ACP methyl ester carboxylesterase
MNENYQEGFVNVKGYKVHFIEWDKTGKKIVVLHGTAAFDWAYNHINLCSPLSDEYHILAFDLLGHGESDDPSEPLGFVAHADIMREAARAKGFTRVILIGYSFGGWISMRYAAKYPEDVEKVVILDAAPRTYAHSIARNEAWESPTPPMYFINEEEAVNYILSMWPSVPRTWTERQVKYFKKDEEGRLLTPSYPTRWENLRLDGDGWSFFKEIRAPILLVRGSESTLATSEDTEKMRQVNKHLKVVTIEGATHLVPISHPEEVLKAVKSFLE